MKIAVLIVGEFRTFEYTRKTYNFLDQTDLDIDVYFHTWNQTDTQNRIRLSARTANSPNLPLKQSEPRIVDAALVEQILARPATICVREMPDWTNAGKFQPLIRSWIWGFDLIRQSGKNYDFVLVMRPDLFFNGSSELDANQISKFHDSNLFATLKPIYHDGLSGAPALEDTMLFASYSTMEKFCSELFQEYRCDRYSEINPDSQWSQTHEWHCFIYKFVTEILGASITTMPIKCNDGVIARWPLDHDSSYQDARNNLIDWRRKNSTFFVYAVAGDFLPFVVASKNYSFLNDQEVAGFNLYYFWKSQSEHLFENVGRPGSVELLDHVPGQNEFEATIKNWLAVMERIPVSAPKQTINFVCLCRSDIMFENPVSIDVSQIWQSDAPHRTLFLAKNSHGYYTMDMVLGDYNWLKTKLNQIYNDYLAQPQHVKENWQGWWYNYVNKLRHMELPLSETNFGYLKLSSTITK